MEKNSEREMSIRREVERHVAEISKWLREHQLTAQTAQQYAVYLRRLSRWQLYLNRLRRQDGKP